MKKTYKIIAIILILVMAMTVVLVSCKPKPTEPVGLNGLGKKLMDGNFSAVITNDADPTDKMTLT